METFVWASLRSLSLCAAIVGAATPAAADGVADPDVGAPAIAADGLEFVDLPVRADGLLVCVARADRKPIAVLASTPIPRSGLQDGGACSASN